jgi:ribonuclease P protein component
VDVFFAASPVSHSRLGLIVPKHGHRIVDRNLLKRRLREIGRRTALPALDAAGARVDLLLRARRSAYGVSYAMLEDEVTSAVEAVCLQDS